jgi:carboxymethylenebutenolidase
MNWKQIISKTKPGCLAVLLIVAGYQHSESQEEDQKSMTSPNYTQEQQAMIEMWERHMAAEFQDKSIDATMATMSPNPFVNHVPVMTGGVGFNDVRHFYNTYFLPGHPPDTASVPVARTVGKDRIVDELIHKFTHTIEMPWILPGIKPTGKRVEIAVIVVVEFKDGKIAGERIYWDQASVLAQIGLIDAEKLPATGIEASRKVLNPSSEPSNRIIQRVSE